MDEQDKENTKGFLRTLIDKGISEAWNRTPITLKLKILGGLAIALLIFIIIVVILSSNPFNFMNYVGGIGGNFDDNFTDFWYIACDENNCSDEQLEAYNELKKSQEKFYNAFTKLTKANNLSLEQLDLILTTIYFNYQIDDFNDYNADNSAFTIGDYENENYSEINIKNYDVLSGEYKEETDSLRELVKQFKVYAPICYPSNEGESNYILKDPNGKGYSFSFLEYVFHNASNLEGYDEAVAACNGEVHFNETTSNDKYFTYLEETSYLDTRNNFREYYRRYADLYDLDIDDIKNWSEDNKRNVRKQIVEDIKKIVEEQLSTKDNINYTPISYNNLFWWPIGSNETTINNGIVFATGEPASTTITSGYGYRTLEGTLNNHGGVDLSGGTTTPGVANVIAARSGTVFKVVTGCISGGDMRCGGSYGNYVIIMHPDGLYTLYAHMHENTITVEEGQTVSQGQVIGKAGNSGHSFGTHLHFEVRLNSDIGSRTNPLDYIDPSNPRPTNNSSNLVTMLTGFEGGNNIVICNEGDVPTVGHGITLTYNYDYFAKYGYPLTTNNSYYNYCGSTFPNELLDAIYAELVSNYKEGMLMQISSLGLNLEENQIDALVSLKYNCGNIEGFKSAYDRYGSSEALCTNWWNNKAITAGGKVLKGLQTRRRKECNLFVNGIYDGSYS